MENNNDKQEIEINEDRAILWVPHNALEGRMEFKLYMDGKIVTVAKTLTQDDLLTAVRKAEAGYIDEDDRFELTEAGKEYVQSLMQQKNYELPLLRLGECR